MPERAVPFWTEGTRMPLVPSMTISDIGGRSLVMIGRPNAVAS